MNNQSVFWKSPELSGLELQKAAYRTHAFTPHFHDEYAIGVFLRGAQEKFYRGATHTISEGSIYVINPGEIHYGYPIDEHGWTYRMVYVSADLVKDIASQIFGQEQDYPYLPELSIKDETLFDNIVNLHHTFKIPGGSLLKKRIRLYFCSWRSAQKTCRYTSWKLSDQVIQQTKQIRSRKYWPTLRSIHLSWETCKCRK